MKYILFVLTVTLFLSCSGNNKSTKRLIGMSNPVKEVSYEYIQDNLNLSFSYPSEAVEIHYSVISDNLAQMSFVWNGCDCLARKKYCNNYEDISGLYYSWEKEASEKINGHDIKVRYLTIENGNVIANAVWYDSKKALMTSFYMNIPGIGPGDIDDIRRLCLELACSID